ncbi:MAG: TIGR03905 family TSCPD domain-containing protein [Oscillospiraceae bacterium]|nr:TIGR03905 family TSCPD domain-containing protein [Oscillospiraceae bacterium]
MQTIKYTPKGVCARQMEIDIEDGKIVDFRILGGCHGNGQGVSALVKGMEVEDVIERLENIRCGNKMTSCPAQLAEALKENYDGE